MTSEKEIKTNSADTAYEEGLYLLWILYARVICMLATVCKGKVFIRDSELNFYYINFTELITNILNDEHFKEFKDIAPELIESLVGDLSNVDTVWNEFLSRDCYDFYAKIDKAYMKAGTPVFNLPTVLEAKLQLADTALTNYKSKSEKAFENMLNQADAVAKVNKTAKTENPVINSSTINYDKITESLVIGKHSIRFQKDSFRARLIELLLASDRNRKKEWLWDDIFLKIEGDDGLLDTKKKKKSFYSRCDGLAKFISQKTGINDFIIFNKTTVRINPKYLN